MKGINLKKIGAIVAGSAILASSVAFAGLVYQNTPLVDANGQPVVKIVVGEKAMASDGVVAAYIASKIGNEAYKTSTLTAQVVGEGSCAGPMGEGTCTVSNEKVELLVTVPGSGAADRVEYDAAIGDYLDKELKNRYRADNDGDEAYTVLDDYSDEEMNPYTNYVDGMLDSVFDDIAYKAMVRVGSEFGPFANVNVQPRGSASPIKEAQFFTFSGKNRWDGGDEELETVLDSAGYVVIFDVSGDYGLPLCPGDPGKNLHLCADTDELPSKKVYIKFLNEDWIISEVNPASSSLPATDQNVYHTDGSSIKLAKEAVSGIVNVGEVLDTGTGYQVRLDDISMEVGVGNDHPAIITVLDSNGNEVCQDQVWPGETEENLCDSTGVKLHVYQTAPGVMLIAKWAEMGIFADEIELIDGKEFIEDSGSEWEVFIGWSNKVGSGGNDTKGEPEYLRGIYLYSDDPEAGNADEMTKGDKFPVVDLRDYHKFDLIYNGIDDSNADYDDLKYKLETSAKRMQVRNGTSPTDTCYMNLTPDYVKITTGKSEFRAKVQDSLAGQLNRKGAEMYWLPVGAVDDTCHYGDPADGSVLLKDNNGDWWFFNASSFPVFDYRWAGSDGAIGPILSPYIVSLVENVGKIKYDDGTSVKIYPDAVDLLSIWYDGSKLVGIYDGEDDEVSLDIFSDATASTFISLPELGYSSGTDYEAKFVSLRGTQFVNPSGTSKHFKVPKSVLGTTYTFTTVAAAEAEPDTHTLIMGEGEEETIGTTGVKIKVVEITETVSPCTLGTGASTPTCNMDGVSAVIMPNNAPTVTVKEVYPLTSNLVLLDRDATGLDTGTVITVGGDVVNTVTRDTIAGTDVDFTAQPVVVRVIGNKIVVAGLTAQDTISAGQQFVAELRRN